jgi:hypothetical protein
VDPPGRRPVSCGAFTLRHGVDDHRASAAKRRVAAEPWPGEIDL